MALGVIGAAHIAAEAELPPGDSALRSIDDAPGGAEEEVLGPYGLAGRIPRTGPDSLRVQKLPPVPCNCCSGGNGIGCDCPPCQDTVCAADAFCCDVEWDSICDGEAATMCTCCATGCGGGPLRLEWGPSCAPGDVDYEIYGGVIFGFPAYTHGPLTCTTGGALAQNIDPGPDNEYYLVVPVNPYGIEGSYGTDSNNTQRPQGSGGACAAQNLHPCAFDVETCNCCSTGHGVGCDCPPCEEIICAGDAFCCDVEWDQICADAAAVTCNCCTDGCNTGPCNCCTGGDGIGCDCPPCENTVCAADAFCCDVEWDSICDGEAATMCTCCDEGCLQPSEGDDSATVIEPQQRGFAPAQVDADTVIKHHIRVVTDGSRPAEITQASQEALWVALSAGVDNLTTGLKAAQALVQTVDPSMYGLLAAHLEDLRDEAEASGRQDLVREAERMLRDLE